MQFKVMRIKWKIFYRVSQEKLEAEDKSFREYANIITKKKMVYSSQIYIRRYVTYEF